jgi:hypothetical protein
MRQTEISEVSILLPMENSLMAKVVRAERDHDQIRVTFADGRQFVFASSLLSTMYVRGEEPENSSSETTFTTKVFL